MNFFGDEAPILAPKNTSNTAKEAGIVPPSSGLPVSIVSHMHPLQAYLSSENLARFARLGRCVPGTSYDAPPEHVAQGTEINSKVINRRSADDPEDGFLVCFWERAEFMVTEAARMLR